MVRGQPRGPEIQEHKNSFVHVRPSWLPDATWPPSDSPAAVKPLFRLSVSLKEAARFLMRGRTRFVISPILRKHCLKLARGLPGANTWWGISETRQTDQKKFSWRELRVSFNSASGILS